ncbi:hypothetical protein ACFL02_04480 [Planctomycetota bacterium]
MTKRCIGIDFDSSEIRAVQIARTGDRFRLEKVFRAPRRRQSDRSPDVLQSLVRRHGFQRRAVTAVSLPQHALFFHIVNDADAIPDSSSPSPTKDNFPVAGPQAVMQRCSAQNSAKRENPALMTAAVKTQLNQHLELLQNARLRCELVDAPVFALHTAVTINHPDFAAGTGIIIYAGDSHTIIALTQNKTVLTARNIPHPTQPDASGKSAPPPEPSVLLSEVEITWRSVFGEKIPEKTPVVLAGSICENIDLPQILQQKLLCRTIVFDPSLRVDRPNRPELNSKLCIAEGLALRVLAPHHTIGPNLIKANRQTRPKNTSSKKQFHLAVILASAVAAVWLIGLTVRKAYLENKYTNIKNQIKQTFRQTLPEQKNIGDELAQLAQMDLQLQSFQRRHAQLAPLAERSVAPLQVLHLITANTPDRLPVHIDEVWIYPDAVRLTAHCDSFASLDEWRKYLLKIPQFAAIEVQDQNMQSDRRIHFILEITLTSEQR